MEATEDETARLKKTDGRVIAGRNVSHQLVEAVGHRPVLSP